MRIETSGTRALGVEHPVALAAMDLVADARLSLAVLDAGGYAFLGAGYGDEPWLTRELAILAPQARARNHPFGVGFITWSLAKRPSLLDLALGHGPDSIWLSFGDPAPFVHRVHAAGAKVVCQVQTEAMAKAALDAGADILVAQGAEAGGHGVARGTLALVPSIVDLAGPDVPVLAAGGVGDGRGLAACLMLGAAGVVMGTRFYATLAAAGREEAKRRIVEAAGDDTLRGIVFDISRGHVWPAPFTGRCLSNAHSRRWEGRELDLLRAWPQERERYLEARSQGDYEVAAVIAGEVAGLIHEVPTAGDIVRRIVEEAAVAIRSGNALLRTTAHACA